MSYAFAQLRGNKANLNNLVPGETIFEGQIVLTKDEKSIYGLLNNELVKLGEVFIGTSEPEGAERGKIFIDEANETIKRYEAASDTYIDLLKPLRDKDQDHELRITTLENAPAQTGTTVETSATNGNITVNGIELVVYRHPATHTIQEIDGLDTALAAKADKSVTDDHETRITDLENAPAVTPGDKVTDSQTNGNIQVNGSEVQVFDDTAIQNALSGKQPAGDYATHTELTDGLATKEDTIGAKGSAFNRDFSGNGVSNTVSRSDHNHDSSYGSKQNEHTHSNKADIDRLGVSTNNKLTIDGVEQTTSGSGGGTVNASPYFVGAGSCYAYNASASKLNVGSNAKFTVEMWIKPVPGQSQKYLMNKNYSASQLAIIYNYSGSPGVEIVAQVDLRTGSFMAITEGVWSHIAYVYDGNILRGYVNGVKQIELTKGLSMSLTLTNIVYGAANTSGSNVFQGAMNEIRFWTEARAEVDILANWNKVLVNPTSYPNLKEYYPNTTFKFGASLIDSSTGTLENLSLTGTAWTMDYPPIT
jgi:hypothetical protein